MSTTSKEYRPSHGGYPGTVVVREDEPADVVVVYESGRAYASIVSFECEAVWNGWAEGNPQATYMVVTRSEAESAGLL